MDECGRLETLIPKNADFQGLSVQWKGEKMKSIIMITTIASFFLSGNIFATEKWEQELMDQGWVKVNPDQLGIADSTWYGIKSKFSDQKGLTRYIYPDGLKILEKIKNSNLRKSGSIEKKDESICIKWSNYHFTICLTIWKMENIILLVPPWGHEATSSFYGNWTNAWIYKKGNPKNF